MLGGGGRASPRFGVYPWFVARNNEAAAGGIAVLAVSTGGGEARARRSRRMTMIRRSGKRWSLSPPRLGGIGESLAHVCSLALGPKQKKGPAGPTMLQVAPSCLFFIFMCQTWGPDEFSLRLPLDSGPIVLSPAAQILVIQRASVS